MSNDPKNIDSKNLAHKNSYTDQFLSILTHYPGIAYLQAQDYSIRFANSKFIEQYGEPGDKTCYDVIWGRTEPCDDCPTFNVFKTNKPITWKSSHEDGRTYTVYDYPFVAPDGEQLVLEMSIDATEQHKAELELDRAKETYKGIFQNSQVGLSRTRLSDGKFIELNNYFVEMFGYSNHREFIENNSAMQCYADPNDRETLKKLLARDGHVENFVAKALRKDGSDFWVKFSAQIGSNKEYVDVVIVDIDKEKRVDEEIKASEEKYRTLFEESNDILFVTTPEGSILDMNPAGLKLFGYTKEEIRRLDLATDLYNDPEKREELKKELIANGSIKNFEAEFKTKSAKVHSGILSANAIRNKAGDIVEFRGILHDITERKWLEAQLLHSQKMEAIGRLAGGIAHDFNNILTVTKTLADLAINKVDTSDPLMKYLKPISESSDRATNLVQQLLLFSQNRAPNTDNININRTITGLLEMLQHLISEDILITTDLSSDLLQVEADNARLEQLLTNLVVNASEAMPGGGSINIRTWNAVDAKKECCTVPGEISGSEQHACIEVTDTGAGMEPGIIEHIFEPFFTTDKTRGTGMGLAVVYGIVKELNGCIDVNSTPGEGSSIKICIPALMTIVETVTEDPPPPTLPSGDGLRILLVEDNKWVRQSTALLLTDNGYEVFQAKNAEKAISLFYHEKGQFDLVISDVIMPGRSGIELLGPLLEINPNVPVLLCSGHIDNKEQFDEIIQKRIPYIQKPYTNHELLLAIKEIIQDS